jgi:hypothetical protein
MWARSSESKPASFLKRFNGPVFSSFFAKRQPSSQKMIG